MMYPTTPAYKTAIAQNVRDVCISGTITLRDDTIINITDEDIQQGSLYFSEQCVSDEDIEIGNVYASEMGLTLTTPLENPYSLDGARIALSFGVNIDSDPDNPPTWEYVPLGYYYVTEIQRKNAAVNLKALDGLILFDVGLSGVTTLGTPQQLIASCCNKVGVALATNTATFNTFANAETEFSLPQTGEGASKAETCRDLIMWVCQVTGTFARMNRLGQLELVPVTARTSTKTIAKPERFTSDVSDFSVKITKVSMKIGESEYENGTDGMTMVLEENPLLLSKTGGEVNTALDNILAQVTQAEYTPLNVDFNGDPSLQAGDWVMLPDTGILGGGDVVSIITHMAWRYRGPHNVRAAGKSGLTRNVSSQQAKAVSSIVAIATAAQQIAQAANQSTQLINDAIGGHVLIRKDGTTNTNEILIMDHADPEQAVKIWRWNMGGLGYSDNVVGADNPLRDYAVAMTMDGAISADFIKTGTLDAALVFADGIDANLINVDELRSISTQDDLSKMVGTGFEVYDPDQNLVGKLGKYPTGASTTLHTEDAQADFAAGTLVDVVATTAGNLELEKWHEAPVPTFTRASTKLRPDGTEVAAGVPMYTENGYHSEEGCTNILASFPSGWARVQSGTSNIVAANQGAQAGAAGETIRLTNSGTSEGYYFSPHFTLSPSTAYTVRIKIRGTAVGSQVYVLSETGTQVQGMWGSVITASWQVVTFTFTTTSDITGTRQNIRIDHDGNDAGYIEIAEISLIQKAYALGFPGYGATKMADLLEYDLAQPLPDEWFMSMKWVPDQGSTIDRTNNSALAQFYNENMNRILLSFVPGADAFNLIKNYQGNSITLSSGAVTYSTGNEISLAAANFTQAHGELAAGMHLWLKIGSGAVVHVSNTDINIPNAMSKCYIGCLHAATYEANGSISNVKLVDIAAAEAAGMVIDNAWAETHLTATTPPTPDPSTLLVANFDGTLTPEIAYKPSGYRVSPSITVDQEARLTWAAILKGQTVTMETNLSRDGGSTWAGWEAVSSGDIVPGTDAGNMSNAVMRIRENLATADMTITPQLNSVTVFEPVYRYGLWSKNGELLMVAPPVGAGIRVVDPEGNEKVIIGQYAEGKYGIKAIGGEIFSTSFRSGAEGSANYIEIAEGYEPLRIVRNNKDALILYSDETDNTFIELRDVAVNETRGYVQANTGGSYGDGLAVDADEGNLSLVAYYGTIYMIGNVSLLDGRVSSHLRPDADDVRSLGASGNRWYRIYAHLTNFGDLGFIETECAICGERFKDGDILCLMVKTIDEEEYTLTIPVHEQCKDVATTITVQVPERVKRYRLNDHGEVEEYLGDDFKEVEEKKGFIKEDFKLDENTGLFRRVGVSEFSSYAKGDIRIGGYAPKYEETIETKVVKAKKAKYRDITITLNPKTPEQEPTDPVIVEAERYIKEETQ